MKLATMEKAALVVGVVGTAVAVTASLLSWATADATLGQTYQFRTVTLRPVELGASGWMWLLDTALLVAAVAVAVFTRGRVRLVAKLVGALLLLWSLLDLLFALLGARAAATVAGRHAWPAGPDAVHVIAAGPAPGLANGLVATLLLGLALVLAYRPATDWS